MICLAKAVWWHRHVWRLAKDAHRQFAHSGTVVALHTLKHGWIRCLHQEIFLLLLFSSFIALNINVGHFRHDKAIFRFRCLQVFHLDSFCLSDLWLEVSFDQLLACDRAVLVLLDYVLRLIQLHHFGFFFVNSFLQKSWLIRLRRSRFNRSWLETERRLGIFLTLVSTVFRVLLSDYVDAEGSRSGRLELL